MGCKEVSVTIGSTAAAATTPCTGYGSDRLIGGDGQTTVCKAALQAGIGQSVLTGGAGHDTFDYQLQTGGSSPDDPEGDFYQVNDLITDFSAGEDKIIFSFSSFDEVEGTSEKYVFDFSDLDTNGNGIVTDADDACSITLVSFKGEGKYSLTIDTGFMGGSGTVTLFGVPTVTASESANGSGWAAGSRSPSGLPRVLCRRMRRATCALQCLRWR